MTISSRPRNRPKPRLRLWALGAFVALGVAVLVAALAGRAGADSLTFVASADAYVSDAARAQNYGTATELEVDQRPIIHSYVRYDVQNLPAAITRATLRLRTVSSSSKGIEVRATSSAWGETTITYANAPARSQSVTRKSGSFSSGQWLALDVTPLLTGSGPVSFALTTTQRSGVLSLASRERGAATAPQLLVETGSAPPPPPPPGGDPVVAGAGDIANGAAHDTATADVLAALNPTAVLTLGDNAYPDGTPADYQNYYEPTWGQFKARTNPSPGNHDYHTAGAPGYFGYFGTRAPAAYYAWNIGAWRFYSLNSEIAHDATSPQISWLKQELAANPRACVAAYWHKPLFSSGMHGNDTSVRPFWDALYAANADLVLVAHDHLYERFGPQTPAAERDLARGIREFVVGTGGASSLYAFTTIQPNSEVRQNTTWGVLRVTLHASSYDWTFEPVSGQSFTDSGSESCH